MTPLVEMRGIEKRFPGVHALKDVQFDLMPGEVHALMGENGAGTSTLMKIMAGIYRRDGGEMLVDGRTADPEGSRAAQALGIGIIHQELCLMNDLTAAQNVFIGREPRLSSGRLDERALNARAAEIFASMHLSVAPTAKVGSLTIAKQQMIEIAKTLSFRSRVMIMDEPTAALNDAAIAELFVIIRKLRADGVGIVYIGREAILTANPDLKGMFGANGGSAIGVVNAKNEMGADDLVVIGYDSGQAQKDAIRAGVMAGAITQNPIGIGYETVRAAVAAVNGEELPEIIDTGFFWYDNSNIDDPEIEAMLYD
jgi:ABC-type branched-subunit amino acid transport system ATPase component